MTWLLRLASLVCRSVSYYITLHDWVIKWFQISSQKWAAFKLIRNAASRIFPLTSHGGSATKNVHRAHESSQLRRLKCSRPSCILLINRDWTWGRGGPGRGGGGGTPIHYLYISEAFSRTGYNISNPRKLLSTFVSSHLKVFKDRLLLKIRSMR